MASELELLIEQFQRRLLRQERAAAAELTRAYGAVYRRIQERIAVLTEQIMQARAAGETLTPGWLLEQRRLESLLEQIDAEITAWSHAVGDVIQRQQLQAVGLAQSDTAELALAALGPAPAGVGIRWNGLARGAFTDLVGALQQGAPLAMLLDQLGPDAAAAVRETLLTGLAIGLAPRQIASQIRRDCGLALSRALTIARTEVLRSYRTAALRSYAANGDVVQGWIWHAQLSTRTCAVCWAMHGQRFGVGEPFASHPNCRCVPLPQTASWADLGFADVPDTRPAIERGEALFARLGTAEQLAILGPGKLALYHDGTITLADLVGVSYSRAWGTGRYERPLSSITP